MMDVSEIDDTTEMGAAWRAILAEWAHLYGATDPDAVVATVWGEFATASVSTTGTARLIMRVRELSQAVEAAR